MYVIDRGTPGNVGKQSGPECDWCAKTDFSASNNNETLNENVARAHLQVAVWGNALQPEPPAIDPTAFGWSLEEASTTIIPITLPSDTPLAPDDLAVQALPAQCSAPVMVAKVVSMKEQGKLFTQTTMTNMNRCISTDPGMGSKQPVWKLFHMVTMTTINLKLIHHCF